MFWLPPFIRVQLSHLWWMQPQLLSTSAGFEPAACSPEGVSDILRQGWDKLGCRLAEYVFSIHSLLKGWVSFAQLSLCSACACWVSLLVGRSIDQVLHWVMSTPGWATFTRFYVACSQTLPPFTTTSVATPRMVKNSQQCVFLSFCKPLIYLKFNSHQW